MTREDAQTGGWKKLTLSSLFPKPSLHIPCTSLGLTQPCPWSSTHPVSAAADLGKPVRLNPCGQLSCKQTELSPLSIPRPGHHPVPKCHRIPDSSSPFGTFPPWGMPTCSMQAVKPCHATKHCLDLSAFLIAAVLLVLLDKSGQAELAPSWGAARGCLGPPQPEGLGAPGVQAGLCLCPTSSRGAGAPAPLQPAEVLFHPTPAMLIWQNLFLAAPRMVPGTAGPGFLTARSLQNPRAKGLPQPSKPDFIPRVLKQPALQPAESSVV